MILDRPYGTSIVINLLVDRKISAIRDLLPMLEHAVQAGKPPLVVAEDTGISLEKASTDVLGGAKRVEIDKDNTTLIGGGGARTDIDARIAQIRRQKEAATSDYDREQFPERMAKLSGGVAIVKVGAATETELKERKARVEDAVHATQAAAEEGILPGGGVALLRARAALTGIRGRNDDQNAGIQIVARALEEPLRQIARNAGVEPALVLQRVLDGQDDFGFNAATNEFCNLIALGILDPCKVTRSALQNAASIAGLVLTIDCAVANISEHAGQRPAEA